MLPSGGRRANGPLIALVILCSHKATDISQDFGCDQDFFAAHLSGGTSWGCCCSSLLFKTT